MPADPSVGPAYPDPPLADGRVRLRAWRLTDLDCVEGASVDPRITESTTVPAEFSVAEGEAFVRRQWSRANDGLGVSLAITDVERDAAVGLVIVSLRPQPGVGGIGYWIAPGQRRHGYARAAIELVTPWALSALGLHRLEAWVEPDNAASQRALLAAGYEVEGTLRNILTLGDRVADAVVLSRLA